MLIDSHCHLMFNVFDEDRREVLSRAKDAGVMAYINPGITIDDSREIVAAAETIPNLYAAVGIHPNDANTFDAISLNDLRELAGHPKVVAIGEIGLDYYWDKAPRPLQRDVFEQQLDIAKALDKPVVIHQRESAADTMDVLREWAATPHPGLVLHSFSGDLAMAKEAIELGFYIGISGPVTFKYARGLPDVVAALPPDRLLVETDAPFLSPHPFRGKRNEPARVKIIAERIAELQQIPFEVMCDHLTRNAITLFRLPDFNLS